MAMAGNSTSLSGCEMAAADVLAPVAVTLVVAGFIAWKTTRALVGEIMRFLIETARVIALSEGFSPSRRAMDGPGAVDEKTVTAAATCDMERQATDAGASGGASNADMAVVANEILKQELSTERFIIKYLNAEIVHLRRHIRALECQADRLVHQISELELELAAYQPTAVDVVTQMPHAADVQQLEGVDLWFALEAEVSKAATAANR